MLWELIRSRLKAAKSVWQNYFLLGAVWIDNPDNTDFGLNAQFFNDGFLKGDKRLSNSTIETFTQDATATVPKRANCFRCHVAAAQIETASNGMMLSLPSQRITVSQALTDAFFGQ
jgi:hypothetical protein